MAATISHPPNKFIIGSRRSKLALIQTNEVKAKLEALFPECTFAIHEQETLGDRVLDTALSKIGDKGLFTQDLEAGLHTGAIHFAVHSLKDVPTALPKGLTLGAILKREDASDVVVLRKDLAGKFKTLEELAEDAKMNQTTVTIGTSSLRRQAQLKRKYPHLNFADVRGNIDTRLRKLDLGGSSPEYPTTYAALILAWAGLARQGSEYLARVTHPLSFDVAHYAVGQGALGIECRENDSVVLEMLRKLHHDATAQCCLAERGFLARLEGGCHVPVGVITEIQGDHNELVHLHGRILSLDGTRVVEGETVGPTAQAWQVGSDLASKLLSQGADKILDELNSKSAPKSQ